jgi:hypothetical protein
MCSEILGQIRPHIGGSAICAASISATPAAFPCRVFADFERPGSAIACENPARSLAPTAAQLQLASTSPSPHGWRAGRGRAHYGTS